MPKLIEEMAQAVGDFERKPWSQIAPEGRDRYEELVRAAARVLLKRLRESIVTTGSAGYAAWDRFGEDAIMGPEELFAIWTAMLDQFAKENGID